jgi:CelD/BcsL family acetyltransferase involved in cellulose biosynthesis
MIRVFIQNGSASEVFAGIAAEWRQLFAAAGCSPFLSWEWQSAWFESFGDRKTPLILKAYRGEKLIGILPLYMEKRKVIGMPFNRLAFIGTGVGGADYLDIIGLPQNRSEIMSAMLEFLQTEGSFDSIRLESIIDVSETARYLRNVVPERLRISESVGAACPRIDLTAGWTAVLEHSKRAANFKRRFKKLKKMPGFEFRSITTPAEIGEAFERFLRLHENRWANEGGSELTGHPRLVSFQRRLVPALAEAGLVRFDELWIEGECRSSAYGLDDGRSFYYYNSGFDREFSHLSVGLVLLGLSVKHAIERGNSYYDFLRGDETYKFDWANCQTNLVTISVNRHTFPVIASDGIGRGWATLRNVTRSVLPSRTIETLSAWQRTRKRNYQLSD